MTTPRTRLSAADQGDRELVARVRDGDVRSEVFLLERHGPALAALPGDDPSAIGRSGRAALDAARAGEDHDLPFRAVWLALHGTGVLPPADAARNGVWSAYLALPPAWRTAVWHHAVEGEPPAVVGWYAGTGPDRIAGVLDTAYAALGRRLDTLTPDLAVLRRELAEVVLGEHAAAYLRQRAEPTRLDAVDPLAEEERPTRGPALLSGAAAVAAAITLVLGNQIIPLGIDVTQRLLFAGPAVPGLLVERAAADVAPEPTRAAPVVPVVPGALLEPAASDGGPAGDPPGGTSGQPGPGSPPGPPTPPPGPPPQPPQPPQPPVDPPGEPPIVSAPVPGGLGQVEAGGDGVKVQLTPPGSDPVVIEVPVPEVPVPTGGGLLG